ncbi:MAG: hypothetical protein ACI8RD_006527 [Bacillariaceae sp.]|jgi:hypothetical protein
MNTTNRQRNDDEDDAATSSVGDVIMSRTITNHESTSSPADIPQTSKRRVEEIHQTPSSSNTNDSMPHENGSGSGNNNDDETIIATTFHDDDNNVSNKNSYFCIGSGSGCLNRSTSQNCLTRELEQFPQSTQEHVGQDLYGLTEKCIPTVDNNLLDELEIAISSLIVKADAENDSAIRRRRTEETMNAMNQNNDHIGNNSSDTDTDHVDIPYYAYRLAVSKSSSYVHQSQFRLMFLRCTEGNVKKAAKRILRHFKTKLHLFGEDKLVRDIVLDDLNDNDMESLLSGGFQVLKDRDAAGRSVLFGRYTSMKYRTIDNMLRALWYIWMSMLEDPINQMKGVVAVGYEVGKVPLDKFHSMNGTEEDSEGEEIEDDNSDNDGSGGGEDDIDFTSSSGAGGFEISYADDMNSGGFDREMAREIISIPLSVPVRPAGYHLCTDSHQWVGILNTVLVTMCKLVRLRMRIHHGTDQECKYVLMTHGISSDSIPVDETGYMSLTNHIEWIEQRRLSDANKQ